MQLFYIFGDWEYEGLRLEFKAAAKDSNEAYAKVLAARPDFRDKDGLVYIIPENEFHRSVTTL